VKVAGTLDVAKAVTLSLPSGTGLAVTAGATFGDELEVSHDDADGATVRIWNTDESDADGAGECRLEFRREDSGGTQRTTRIAVVHDGTSTDGASRIELRANAGGETDPTRKATVDGAGDLTLTGGMVGPVFADGTDTTKRSDLDLSGITGGSTRTVTVPDGDVRLDGHAMVEAFGGFNVPASQTNYAFGLVLTSELVAAFPGEIRGIGAAANATPAGAGTITVKPFVNNVDQSASLSVTLDNANRTASATAASGAITFTAGQRLNVRADTNASWTPQSVDASLVFVFFYSVA